MRLRKNVQQSSLNKVHGVTLVELMIAIVIGSIVALGISSVYSSSKRSFKLQEEFSRMQENGRFAMNYIARFVRGAGYSGCSSGLENMTNDINSTDPDLLFQTGLEGYEAAGTAPGETTPTLADYPTVTSDVNDFASITSNITQSLIDKLQPLPESDILVARVAEDSGVEISKNAAEFTINYVSTETNGCVYTDPSTNKTKTTTGYNKLCENDFLVVSDCAKSIAFQLSSLQKIGGSPDTVKLNHDKSGNPGNKSAAWGASSVHLTEGYDFEAGSEIVKVTTKWFYIGKGVNGPALFMRDGQLSGFELVEGIENFQVLYGEDTDATPDNIPDRYVPADKVHDFGDVRAVRISVLIRSVKDLPWRPQTSKTYLLGGTTAATATTVTAPNDKRLRRTMSMTILLRNRAFSL